METQRQTARGDLYRFSRVDIIAAMVIEDDETERFVGDQSWEAVMKQAVALNAMARLTTSNESTSITAYLNDEQGRKRVVMQVHERDKRHLVVVFNSGAEVSKSVRRMVRKFWGRARTSTHMQNDRI